jgi:predicted DNA-binding protein with PD1-like motif
MIWLESLYVLSRRLWLDVSSKVSYCQSFFARGVGVSLVDTHPFESACGAKEPTLEVEHVKTFSFEPGTIHLLSLDTGSDLYEAVSGYLREHDIRAGSVACIGAVRSARLGWWDQEDEEYRFFDVSEPCEVISGTGSVSEVGGEPFLHLHISLGNRTGQMVGGHVEAGTEVYAMELTIQELVGDPLIFWDTE